MKKDMLRYEVGDVLVSAAKKNGEDFLVGIPARAGDETCIIKDGILLNVVGYRLFPPSNEFYIIEIVSGQNASDLIFIPVSFSFLMEVVPTKRRLR